MHRSKISSTSNSKAELRFVIRFSVFLLFLSMVLSVFFVLNFHFIKNSKVILEPSVKTVFTGDSHIRGGVFSNLIPNSINIAQKGEPPALSYYKVKKVLQDNENIERIVVAYSYNNVGSNSQTLFNSHRWADEKINRIYPIIPFKELTNIEPDWKKISTVFSKKWLVPNFKYWFNNNENIYKYEFIGTVDNERSVDATQKLISRLKNGKALPNTKLNNHKLKMTLKAHFLKNGTEKLGSVSMRHYNKLIKLTKEHDVDLVFLSMPLHEDYLAGIPKKVKSGYKKNIKKFKKHKHVEFWDYSSLIEDDKLFRNHDHINNFGGVYISELIAERINN